MTASTRARVADGAAMGARIAFIALVVLSPFRARIDLLARPDPPVYGDFTDVLLYWSDIALVATLGCWLLSLAARRRAITLGPRFLTVPIAGLLLVGWAGVPFAVDPVVAADGAIRLVALAALALFVVNELDLGSLRVPLVAMVAIQAVVALAQYADQRSIGLGALGEHALAPDLGVSVVTGTNGVRYLRAYGLTDHPNILGGILAIAILLLIGILATRTRRRPGAADLLAGATVALGSAALFVTFSRAAWLGATVGLVVLGAMLVAMHARSVVRVAALVCAAAAIAVAPLVGPALPVLAARLDPGSRIATEARSIDERAGVAEAANAIFIAHPALGVGIGALPTAMKTADPAFPWDFQPASVIVLDVAAETGIVGAACFLVVLIAPWIALVRRRDRWTLSLAAASAALAAIDLIGFFDYYTWTYPAGRIWWWIVLAIWIVAYRAASGPRPAEAVAGAA